ncbi:MAG: DUF1326 domain-containing protein [Aliifodinibius sp.]|nr:DUF1326 domain-containing protein [Fodinibius sp.]
MSDKIPWQLTGSYYEVCNCDAICPCRRQGEKKGGRSTYGHCDFALSWHIEDGNAGGINLSGLSVVLAGTYNDDEPGSPWRVVLYVDENGSDRQQQTLADIFLGRAGGDTFKNFARLIGEVYAVRPARVNLDHTPNKESMSVGDYVSVRTAEPFQTELPVTCGIPGHHQQGQEIIADTFRVEDTDLQWEVIGRCGYASEFSYSSGD